MSKQPFDKEFILDLPKIEDKRGNLSFIEIETHLPFPITCACWIYGDVEENELELFKNQQKIIIALSGSFDIVINDAESTHTLNSANKALYLPHSTEYSLENYSANSVCLILGSHANNQINKHNLLYDKDNSTPQYYTVADCSLIKFSATEKDLVRIESEKDIPFNIERTFYIYDIPKGEERGRHAHKYCHELLVATTGSFEVDLDDGTTKKTIILDNPKQALHIPPGVWASQKKYSSGVTCLAFASKKYNLDGYINSYEEFKEYRADES